MKTTRIDCERRQLYEAVKTTGFDREKKSFFYRQLIPNEIFYFFFSIIDKEKENEKRYRYSFSSLFHADN
jgi:hypothetical protein